MLIDAPYNNLTREILSAAIEVHRVFGPGLFESTHAPCFHYELEARHLRLETQRVIPVVYKGNHFGARYRVDLIVEGLVVGNESGRSAPAGAFDAGIDLPEADWLPRWPSINFNVARLMDGVKRLVLQGSVERGGDSTPAPSGEGTELGDP